MKENKMVKNGQAKVAGYLDNQLLTYEGLRIKKANPNSILFG